MPRTNPDGSRDYSYDKAFAARPEQKKRRASRNRARAKLKKAGRLLNGKDVDHKDGNPLNNSNSNLRVESPKKNRGRK